MSRNFASISTLHQADNGRPVGDSRPLHVALVLDGNGRWARARGWDRPIGHRAGIDAVRGVVTAAPQLGIATLTLYVFSCDNWKRPATEVAGLMRCLRAFLRREVGNCAQNGVRVSFLGRRDRLPEGLAALMAAAEEATAGGRALQLRLAVDYSSRDAILEAAARLAASSESPKERREEFRRLLCGAREGEESAPDVDLLIRTGGEQRLSDFLLWECAYAELYFTRTLWPDFDAGELRRALRAYARRERRFGGLSASPVRRTA